MTAPRLTSAVRRGLSVVLMFAQQDFEADQSEEAPHFTGNEAEEIRRALAWISYHMNKGTR